VTVISKDKCDQCGAETADRYLYPGWIRVGNVSSSSSKSITISISIDRDSNRHARTAYLSQNDPLDFCGLPCLNKFLTKMLKRAKREIKREKRK
jgi:hypothetical protein